MNQPLHLTASSAAPANRPRRLSPASAAAALAALAVLAALAGCNRKSSSGGGGEGGASAPQVLRIGNGSEPEDLDPQTVTGVTESSILRALFEGLVTYHPETLAPEPGVAKTWETSDDGMVYTFHLRDDAKWSNGEPVTAGDFIFSYRRILNPALGSEYANLHFGVKNALPYFKQEITDPGQLGYAAPDDHTLVITLENPTPHFLNIIQHTSWYPVHPPTIKSFGAEARMATGWTAPETHVGNGSFKLKEWVQDSVIRVVPNPHYWDAARVRLDAIEFHPLVEPNTEERAFRDGQIDKTLTLPLPKVVSYQKSNASVLRMDPYLGNYYYLFNTTKPPLDDVRVRRALSISIDRTLICEKIVRGGRTPAYHLTPPNTAGFTSTHTLREDVAEARRLLAEAGFPGGEGFPVTELLYNTMESHKIVAEAIQQMWKKNLGIDIVLRNEEWKVYLQSREEGEFQIVRAGWIGDYVDPATFLTDLFTSYSGHNHSRWGSDAYDAAVEAAGRTLDRDARFEFFQQAEKILVDESPYLPIYHYTNVYLMQPYVKGWYSNLLDNHPYKYVTIER